MFKASVVDQKSGGLCPKSKKKKRLIFNRFFARALCCTRSWFRFGSGKVGRFETFESSSQGHRARVSKFFNFGAKIKSLKFVRIGRHVPESLRGSCIFAVVVFVFSSAQGLKLKVLRVFVASKFGEPKWASIGTKARSSHKTNVTQKWNRIKHRVELKFIVWTPPETSNLS